MTPHRLTDKDVETRRAICSIDGPVAIRKAGNGYACSVKLNEQARKTKRNNPTRSKTSRSPHRLTWKDPVTRTGTCPKCGPVAIVPWGGGWVCRVRAEELGHVNHQGAVQGYCDVCKILDGETSWLTTDGQCLRCNGMGVNTLVRGSFHDSGAEESTHRGRNDYEFSKAELADADLYAFNPGDPYEMPEYESAVAGWTTLG